MPHFISKSRFQDTLGYTVVGYTVYNLLEIVVYTNICIQTDIQIYVEHLYHSITAKKF